LLAEDLTLVLPLPGFWNVGNLWLLPGI
jgi:hypothetical protein